MSEKTKDILWHIAIGLIFAVFVAWIMKVEKPKTDTEVERFRGIIESTWNQEYDNEEKELTFPWID